jgi:hypothetical protein
MLVKQLVLAVLNYAETRRRRLCNIAVKGRAMAQAVSRRPLTAEARVRSLASPCEICGGQSGNWTGFSPSTSVLPCQFHSIGAPLIVEIGKKLIMFITWVAQEALRLRCVRSICCGALHHAKKNISVIKFLLTTSFI